MKKRTVIILLIVMSIIFIQSALPVLISATESNWLKYKVIDPITWNVFGILLEEETIRKIAHIIEFAILCIAVSFIWKGNFIKSFYSGFSIAFIDESIQMITGRTALILDIWIDLAGVILGAVIGCWVYKSLHNKPKEM